MPQTRFVLKKALAAKVKPIVVINKVDRPVVRIQEVMDEVLELFISEKNYELKNIKTNIKNALYRIDYSKAKRNFKKYLDL